LFSAREFGACETAHDRKQATDVLFVSDVDFFEHHLFLQTKGQAAV
jgi:hypothetical protein